MVTLEDIESAMLQAPSKDTPKTFERDQAVYHPLNSFHLESGRGYQQQYGDMYFLRLTAIKPAVEAEAASAWEGTVIGGETARKVDRVLDVRQGELCWVAGTVYMDMPLKPNILDDVSKDRWISAPTSTTRYFSDDEKDAIMLEDDSGRIRLTGPVLGSVLLVTGCIIAVMGTENANGEFEVVDIKFADLPSQPERWALTEAEAQDGKKKAVKSEDVEMSNSQVSTSGSGSKIAIVSGLNFSGTDGSHALELNLLLEYLLGDTLDPQAQSELSHISMLIIAGNSIAQDRKLLDDDIVDKKTTTSKKYGYDATSYNALPSKLLDDFLAELLPTMPVTLLPGEQDPANATYPQQPIHPVMFPKARAFSLAQPSSDDPAWFDTQTNPFDAEINGWRILGTGGQNLDDVLKYVDTDDRLGMMEAMCRWRCCAPTAPDTLWSYPFQDDDPFVIKECPHLYFVGCQPEFGTKVIRGPEGQSVRLLSVPSFKEKKEFVLVDLETLDVERIRIDVGRGEGG